MSSLDSSFRALLAQILREQDITIPEAAEICGVPHIHFLALVHGPATTTLPAASRILQRLGVEVQITRYLPTLKS